MTPTDSQSRNHPETPLEWWNLIREKGLRVAARSLRVGEIYAIATTLLGVGASLALVFQLKVAKPDDLVPCSSAKDYPLGTWMEAGRALELTRTLIPRVRRHSQNRLRLIRRRLDMFGAMSPVPKV
jgi:hypothetical protein